MISRKEFRNWQNSIEIEGRPIRGIELARRLGRTDDTITKYRNVGVPDSEEPTLRLAMAAISANLKPWGVA